MTRQRKNLLPSGAKRRRIAELAGRYGFLIVEDAPYRLLRYRGKEGDEHLNQGQRRRPDQQLKFEGHAFVPKGMSSINGKPR